MSEFLPVATVTDVKPGTPGIDPTKPIPLKNIVGQNYNVTIYVTVKNEGNYTEKNINVTAYWSNSTHINQTIGSIFIPELLIKTSVTVSITWSTSGIAKGNYTISAYAEPVPGETDTTDNTLVDGVLYVGIPGDINADGKVDMKDIGSICMAYGSYPGHPKWNPNADINDDGKVDMKDIGYACMHYGQHCP